MRRGFHPPLILVSLLLIVSFFAPAIVNADQGTAPLLAPGPPSLRVPSSHAHDLARGTTTLPAAFVENRGQFGGSDIRFVAAFGGLQAGLAPREVVLQVSGLSRSDRGPQAMLPAVPPSPTGTSREVAVVRLSFEGAEPVTPVGLDRIPGVRTFLLGTDPSLWRTRVPAYREVLYRDLYPGIDVRFHATDAGLKYDLFVAPGADPGRVALRVAGADVSTDASGRLHLRTALRELIDEAPTAYQEGPSTRESVAAFRVVEGDLVHLAVGPYDRARTLVIDPLVYATFLGGLGSGESVAVDVSGNLYLAGMTLSAAFPATPGAFDTTCGTNLGCEMYPDVFVSKFSPDGTTLLWATFLGGDFEDSFPSVTTDASGNVYVSGRTNSLDFPTTPGAFSRSRNGLYDDVFLAKLGPNGDALVYSTYLGGSSWETPSGIAVDASGAAYVAGETWSYDFPTTPGAYDTAFSGGSYQIDAFATKFAPDGASLVYSTYLGGSGNERPQDLAVDGSGQLHLTGYATAGFPVTPGAFDTSADGDDAFVAKLNAGGTQLLFGTYLGGTAGDDGVAIAVNRTGTVFVSGTTLSSDFPTTPGVLDRTCGTDGSCDYEPGMAGGQNDAFLTALLADGTGLAFSTYFGGNRTDIGYDLQVDDSGRAVLVGWTSSGDLPHTEGAPIGDVRIGDGFLTRFSADGASISYGTFLGGSAWDVANAVELLSGEQAAVAGSTGSRDFPVTADAVDITPEGGSAFLAVLSMSSELPPTASFTALPEPGHVGEEITFDASNSRAGGAPIASYAWAFGDGSRGTGPIVRHTFGASRFVPVVLTVSDEAGVRGTVAREVAILPRLVPYRHASGFALLVPEDWGRQENVTLVGTLVELTLNGPTVDGVQTNILVDMERNVTAREDPAFLESQMREALVEIRRTMPDAQFSEGPTSRTVAGHGAVEAVIEYPSISFVQDVVLVASDIHDRFWLLVLSADRAAYPLTHMMFTEMVASFEITLPPPSSLPDILWPLAALIPVLVAVAILIALVLARRTRRGAAQRVTSAPRPTASPPEYGRVACPRCGTLLESTFRFCTTCGRAAGPRSPPN